MERGLAPTRSRARDLVVSGHVLIDERVCTRPATAVDAGQVVSLAPGTPATVSRAAAKLEAGVEAFGFDPEGRIAIDVGASTGGFTEVLLAHDAARVYAVDVGHDQLHTRLRADPRVISLEGCDARALTRELVPEPVGAIVADVSFISLQKALPAAMALAAPHAWMVALIKPQFEVGRENIGKGGIVRESAAREGAVETIRTWLAQQPGWRVVGVVPSPIKGGSGNEEFLVGARYDR